MDIIGKTTIHPLLFFSGKNSRLYHLDNYGTGIFQRYRTDKLRKHYYGASFFSHIIN